MCIYVAGVFATNLRSLLLTPPLAQYLERGATDYFISPAEKKKEDEEEEEELVVVMPMVEVLAVLPIRLQGLVLLVPQMPLAMALSP